MRRKTTNVLRQVAETGQPVFVTQYGSVELVLLTRRTYERLRRAAEQEAAPAAGPASGAEPAPAAACGGRERARAGVVNEQRGRAGRTDGAPAEAPTDVGTDPLAIFGRLPRGTLFETRWGFVDAETAAFFMEEGLDVRPHLSPERLRAALDGAR